MEPLKNDISPLSVASEKLLSSSGVSGLWVSERLIFVLLLEKIEFENIAVELNIEFEKYVSPENVELKKFATP